MREPQAKEISMPTQMKMRIRLCLLLTFGLAACQPSLVSDSATAEKLIPPPPEALTVTLESLSPLPADLTRTPAPSSELTPVPLRLELDPRVAETGGLRTYRFTLNIRAWGMPDASRVRMHLPAGASVREVSAAGWGCEQSLKQDDALPGEHLDMDCQNLTTSRTPPAILTILFDLPETANSALACAQVALKDSFEAPLCMEPTIQP
jgi:hypothetical protein